MSSLEEIKFVLWVKDFRLEWSILLLIPLMNLTLEPNCKDGFQLKCSLD